jgi:hypothetical protein
MLGIEYASESAAQSTFGLGFIDEAHICEILWSHPHREMITTPREIIQIESTTCNVCKILLSILDKYAGGTTWVHIKLTITRGYPHDNFVVSGEQNGVMQQSRPFIIFTPSGILQRRIPIWLSTHAYVSDTRL